MTRTQFIVIFEGRTGSSELMARLNKHPKIQAYPEILHRMCGEDGSHSDWTQIELALRQIRNGDAVNTYAESYSKMGKDSNTLPIRGFKTRLNSEADRWWYQSNGIERNFYAVSPEILLNIAASLGYCVIRLYRADLLRQAISWLRAVELARRRNEWNVMASDDPLEAIYLRPEAVLKTVNWLRSSSKRHEAAYDAYLGKKFSMSYERLFSGESEQAYLDILEFLGADPMAAPSHYRKATPDNLSKAVSNLQEIKDALKG